MAAVILPHALPNSGRLLGALPSISAKAQAGDWGFKVGKRPWLEQAVVR